MLGQNPEYEILEALKAAEDSPERPRRHVSRSSIVAGLCAQYCAEMRKAGALERLVLNSQGYMRRLDETFEKLLSENPPKIKCEGGELELTDAGKNYLLEKSEQKTDSV